MDVGLALPHYDHSVPGERPLRWETVVAWARAAEAAGLASVWMSDHLFVSLERWGGPPDEHESLECLVALGALARATSRVRLGTLVLCPHLRPAGVLAKALATVDVLSAGRLTVGLGAGWFRPEYTAAGLPFPAHRERVELLDETVEVLRLAFTGEPFRFEGRHLRLEDLAARPRPVQRPAPPLWVGGRSDRLLAVAGRRADGWNAGGWSGTTDDYRARLAVLERACAEAGRDPASVTRSVNRLVLVGDDEADLRRRFRHLRSVAPAGPVQGMTLEQYRRGRLVGTVEQVRDQLGALEAEGIGHTIVSLGALPFTVAGVDDLDALASASRDLGAT